MTCPLQNAFSKKNKKIKVCDWTSKAIFESQHSKRMTFMLPIYIWVTRVLYLDDIESNALIGLYMHYSTFKWI